MCRMGRPWPRGSSSSSPSTWASANASACSGSWGSACVSPGRHWPKPTLRGRRRINKLQRLLVDPDVELGATDEVHVQQYGALGRVWGPPKIRDPGQRQHPPRKSVGAFGAVRRRDGRFVSRRETASFNGQTFLAFMTQRSRASGRTKRRVVVLTDHAPSHHATLHRPWRDAHDARVVLDCLPPSSPDLNPIERVWNFTRRRGPHNRDFPTVDDRITAVDSEFDLWTRGNETLRRLCAMT